MSYTFSRSQTSFAKVLYIPQPHARKLCTQIRVSGIRMHRLFRSTVPKIKKKISLDQTAINNYSWSKDDMDFSNADHMEPKYTGRISELGHKRVEFESSECEMNLSERLVGRAMI